MTLPLRPQSKGRTHTGTLCTVRIKYPSSREAMLFRIRPWASFCAPIHSPSHLQTSAPKAIFMTNSRLCWYLECTKWQCSHDILAKWKKKVPVIECKQVLDEPREDPIARHVHFEHSRRLRFSDLAWHCQLHGVILGNFFAQTRGSSGL